VTDFRNCSVVSPIVVITQPVSGLQIVLDSIQQDKCGQGTGAIFQHIVGGTLPHQYLWSSGQQTPSITGLPAGMYQLTATDQAGCTKISPFYEIQTLAPPLQIAENVTNALCFGTNTGTVSVVASGGTPAYNYFWSNGQSGPNLNNLPAGNYILTLTDAAGCFDFFTIPVSQPASLAATWMSDSTGGSWAVTLNVTGGTPNYQIQWGPSTGNQTGPVATGLAAGFHTVKVTDSNGCMLALEIFVGTVGTEQPESISALQLFPNPTSGEATLTVQLERPLAVEVLVFNNLGQIVFLQKIDERQANHSVPLELEGLGAGLYFVKIGLENGETRVLRLVISN